MPILYNQFNCSLEIFSEIFLLQALAPLPFLFLHSVLIILLNSPFLLREWIEGLSIFKHVQLWSFSSTIPCIFFWPSSLYWIHSLFSTAGFLYEKEWGEGEEGGAFSLHSLVSRFLCAFPASVQFLTLYIYIKRTHWQLAGARVKWTLRDQQEFERKKREKKKRAGMSWVAMARVGCNRFIKKVLHWTRAPCVTR